MAPHFGFMAEVALENVSDPTQLLSKRREFITSPPITTITLGLRGSMSPVMCFAQHMSTAIPREKTGIRIGLLLDMLDKMRAQALQVLKNTTYPLSNPYIQPLAFFYYSGVTAVTYQEEGYIAIHGAVTPALATLTDRWQPELVSLVALGLDRHGRRMNGIVPGQVWSRNLNPKSCFALIVSTYSWWFLRLELQQGDNLTYGKSVASCQNVFIVALCCVRNCIDRSRKTRKLQGRSHQTSRHYGHFLSLRPSALSHKTSEVY